MIADKGENIRERSEAFQVQISFVEMTTMSSKLPSNILEFLNACTIPRTQKMVSTMESRSKKSSNVMVFQTGPTNATLFRRDSSGVSSAILRIPSKITHPHPREVQQRIFQVYDEFRMRAYIFPGRNKAPLRIAPRGEYNSWKMDFTEASFNRTSSSQKSRLVRQGYTFKATLVMRVSVNKKSKFLFICFYSGLNFTVFVSFN